MQVLPQRALGQRPGHFEQDPGALVSLGMQRSRPEIRVFPETQVGVVQYHQVRRSSIPDHLLPVLDTGIAAPVQAQELSHPPGRFVAILDRRPHGVGVIIPVVIWLHLVACARRTGLTDGKYRAFLMRQIPGNRLHQVGQ